MERLGEQNEGRIQGIQHPRAASVGDDCRHEAVVERRETSDDEA